MTKPPKLKHGIYTTTTDTTHYRNGRLHNLDGPAVIFKNGNKFWYLHGRQMSESQWKVERQYWIIKNNLNKIL